MPLARALRGSGVCQGGARDSGVCAGVPPALMLQMGGIGAQEDSYPTWELCLLSYWRTTNSFPTRQSRPQALPDPPEVSEERTAHARPG